MNRKNSTCLQTHEAAVVAPEPGRGSTPVAEPRNDTPVATSSATHGSDITNLPNSYWDYPSGNLITSEVIDNYENLLSTLCDGITDEEGLKNLEDIRNFLENWRKQKDDHNKKVVLECLHDFHSLTRLIKTSDEQV